MSSPGRGRRGQVLREAYDLGSNIEVPEIVEQCSKSLLVDDYGGLYYPIYIGDCNNPIEESLYTNQ